MFQFQAVLWCLVTMMIYVVAHVGHGTDFQTKNAIQDALLSYLCQGTNGFPCNGHGSCSSGMCTCFEGYGGSKCERNYADLDFGIHDTGLNAENVNLGQLDLSHPGVTFRHPTGSGNEGGETFPDLVSPPLDNVHSDILACMEGHENACNGNGYCQGGSCVCESGYSGILCELSTEVGFCHTYKECAECTAFMQVCPEKCDIMAKFRLVFGFPKVPAGSDSFRKCRFRSNTQNCTYFFKQASEEQNGHKVIEVMACLATQDSTGNTSVTVTQVKDTPSLTVTESTQPTASVKTPAPEIPTDPHDGHIHPHEDETGDTGEQSQTGSGTRDGGPGNGKPCVRSEFMLMVACLFLALILSLKKS